MKDFTCIRNLVLFSLFSLISLAATAQRNLKPGYIVNLKGDTTKGYVDYKDWVQNPGEITFGTEQQRATLKTYSTGDIKAFGVNGFDHYRGEIVQISKNAVQIAQLGNNKDTSFITDTVFLRIVTTGKNVTLFQYTDDLKDRFYIAEGIATPVELKRYLYFDPKQTSKLITINTFTQQLQRLVATYQAGNRALIDDVLRAEYRQKDISKVILSINGNAEEVNLATINRVGTRFYIGAAANFMRYYVGKQSEGTMDYIRYGTPQNVTVPYVNGGVDVFFNKNVKRLFVRTEIGLSGISKVRYSDIDWQVEGTVKKEERITTFNTISVAITPQVIYNFYNSDNFKVYFGAGAQINLNFYSNQHNQIDFYLGGNLGQSYDNPLKLNSFAVSPLGRAGMSFTNIEVYAAYIGPTPVGGYSLSTSSYRIGLNYALGK